MKKVIMFISLITIALIGFKINTNASQTFTRTTETVSFAGADYTLLKSPFAQSNSIKGYFADIIYEQDGVTFEYFINSSKSVVTPVNSLGQYNYGSIASYFKENIDNWVEDDIIFIDQYFSIIDRYDKLVPSYNIVIDYTFSSPNDIIVNVDTVGWFQVSTGVSKVSLDIYVSYYVSPQLNGIVFTDYYLSFYDNNNALINTSGAFGGWDTWIGIAFHDISQVDYDSGYQSGYNNGVDDGFIDGYNNGYNNGVDDGYNNGLVDGYLNGYDDGTQLDTDVRPMFQTLITFIGSVFSLTIFPGVTIGTLASIPIMFALFKWFMRMFGGK